MEGPVQGAPSGVTTSGVGGLKGPAQGGFIGVGGLKGGVLWSAATEVAQGKEDVREEGPGERGSGGGDSYTSDSYTFDSYTSDFPSEFFPFDSSLPDSRPRRFWADSSYNSSLS